MASKSWPQATDRDRDRSWSDRDRYSNDHYASNRTGDRYPGQARGYEDDYRGSSGEPIYARAEPSRESHSGQRDDWQRADQRGDDEGQHYRGYYGRAVSPYNFDGGNGNRYVETWAISGPHSGRGPKGYRRSDQQVVEEACQRLERDGGIDATDIEVSANDGVIELEGSVNTRDEKRRAEACVESIYGVRDVMNRLRVAAASQRTGAAQGGAAQSAQDAGASSGSEGSFGAQQGGAQHAAGGPEARADNRPKAGKSSSSS